MLVLEALVGLHAAAAAKSLQSCPTLCDPIDGSPPGSTMPGILQARTLEWVAISFYIEPFNFSFFSITGQGIDLDYHDIEWFALETNRDHSVVFEAASKYCISDSFVDYNGYSISSKGFLALGIRYNGHLC